MVEETNVGYSGINISSSVKKVIKCFVKKKKLKKNINSRVVGRSFMFLRIFSKILHGNYGGEMKYFFDTSTF